MIGIIYTTVVTMILLFPWLILALMMAGALRDRWKVRPEYARVGSRTPVRGGRMRHAPRHKREGMPTSFIRM